MGSKEESLSSEPSVQGEGSLFFDLANGPIQDDSSERADNSSSELLEQESNPDELASTPEDSSWDFRELPLSERIDIRDAWGEAEDISSIKVIDDKHVLFSSFNGWLYLGSFDNKGKLVSSGQINVADDKGSSVDTCTVEVTGDGRALLGGWGGAFYVNYSISDDHADASGGL